MQVRVRDRLRRVGNTTSEATPVRRQDRREDRRKRRPPNDAKMGMSRSPTYLCDEHTAIAIVQNHQSEAFGRESDWRRLVTTDWRTRARRKPCQKKAAVHRRDELRRAQNPDDA